MYRLTKYDNHGEKIVDEFEDEDVLRREVDICLNEIEFKKIKTFSVSWIRKDYRKKGFWEK